MDERDDLIRERERGGALDKAEDDRGVVDDDSTIEVPGDVLGIAHVRPTGKPLAERAVRDREEESEEGAAGGPSEQSKVGTRDVTDGTTGGTGPDTGGSGALRRGSGATGTDLGS